MICHSSDGSSWWFPKMSEKHCFTVIYVYDKGEQYLIFSEFWCIAFILIIVFFLAKAKPIKCTATAGPLDAWDWRNCNRIVNQGHSCTFKQVERSCFSCYSFQVCHPYLSLSIPNNVICQYYHQKMQRSEWQYGEKRTIFTVT